MRAAIAVGLALVSVAGCATKRSWEGLSERFGDPVVYCAAVGNIDAPDERWDGPPVPPSVAEALSTQLGVPPIEPDRVAWRCMGGRVYACTVGANIPCDARADTGEEPTEGMVNFCEEQPGAEVIPAYAAGRETVYAWRCNGPEPAISAQLFTPDPRGFDPNVWYQVHPGAQAPPSVADEVVPEDDDVKGFVTEGTPDTSAGGPDEPAADDTYGGTVPGSRAR
jgi:hypothetical protein